MVDTTSCPECGLPAEVQERAVLDSTDGPVEHARIFCASRHWFFLPVSMLDTPRTSTTPDAARARVTGPIRPRQ